MTKAERIFPVILSGGTGTRLWPMSRASLPKQLLALHGPRTMIQDTVLRANVPNAATPLLICGDAHRFLVAEQMQAIGASPRAIVLEPTGRNTAPAAVIAALLTAEEDPQGIVLLLPSDHVVSDEAAFRSAVVKAARAARLGYLVTFGLAPSGPETGYGYIQRDATLRDAEGVNAVRRFVEKPDLATAETYLASGDYFWNSGMFVFRSDVLIEEATRHAPQIVEACRAALAKGVRDPDFVRLDAASFEQAPSISIDYAIMEKTKKAAVVSCNLGWSDVGAWSALWSLEKRDADGNVLQGDVLVHDSKDSFVRGNGRLTALVGVRDLVVIVTDDAVLVADRNRTQDVKAIVDKLKDADRPEHLEHPSGFRP